MIAAVHPSRIACVVSWATMSCERQVNTRAARDVGARIGPPPPRNSRTAGRPCRAVVGVGLAERVRMDRAAAGRTLPSSSALAWRGADRRGRQRTGRPRARSKCLDRLHRHRVDHLLVELRVALARRPAVLRQQSASFEVHRIVPRCPRRPRPRPPGTRRPAPASASSQRTLSATSLMPAVSRRVEKLGSSE